MSVLDDFLSRDDDDARKKNEKNEEDGAKKKPVGAFGEEYGPEFMELCEKKGGR